MTSQILDTVVYQNEDFKLIWDIGLEQFIRSKYDLKQYTKGFTTICDRGYVARFEIKNAHLYITELYVFGMVEPFLIIDGQEPEKILYRNSRSARKRRKLKLVEDEHRDSGWVKYSSLLERISATGYIVVGQQLKEYDNWVDFPKYFPYVCNKLLRITLVSGQPKLIEDFSKEAEEVRNQLSDKLPTTNDEKQAVDNLHQKVFRLRKA